MAAVSPEGLRAHVVSLAHRTPDVRELALGAARILRRVVPFDGVCVLALDPATLLPTGEVVENGLPPTAVPRMAEIEVGEQDVDTFRARRARRGALRASARRPAAISTAAFATVKSERRPDSVTSCA